MTEITAANGSTHSSASPKVERAATARLIVEAEQCPLVLRRVLDAIADRDITPFTIFSRRDTRFQFIEVEMIALPEASALLVLQDLRRLRNVRVARFACPLPSDES
jgi:hypothetical protein